jgi:cephalosporin hydroxylase
MALLNTSLEFNMDQPWNKPDPEMVEILNRYTINGWYGNSWGTDKDFLHNYTGIYQELLAPFRNQSGKLLEIGARFGGSALLWHTYLPKFLICMMDIENLIHPRMYEEMQYQRYQFNLVDAYQSSAVEMVENMYQEGFEVVIDDGGHTLDQQLFSIQHYLPMVKPGGVFIIEDVQDPDHIQLFIQALPENLSNNYRVFDNRATKNRYDDLIFSVNI